MMHRSAFLQLPMLLLVLPACSDSGRTGPSAPLILAAGLQEVAPSATSKVGTTVDLRRLGLRGSSPAAFELTTPAGVPFSFDVVSLAAGNAGSVSIAVAHARDGSAVPTGGPESIAAAGCVPLAPGLWDSTPWLETTGDGFARLSIRGAIEREQVFAFTATNEQGTSSALVRVAIGSRSAINQDATTQGNHPGVVAQQTLYSSDSWYFGMPTAAVSGDRTSIVVYDGDRSHPQAFERREVWLQHEAATGLVTGGGALETGLDSGNWRDHEIAALHNVLALANCGSGDVVVQLSFDRGATIGQTRSFAAGSHSTRLVQLAMAGDYTLAVLFWRSPGSADNELMLVEGRPSSFDAYGSPTAFAFDPPQVLHRAPGQSVPLPMGVAWSAGGDLAIGHAYSRLSTVDSLLVTETEFHSAVRLHGGEFVHRLVDQERTVSRDPSVAVLGQGPGLQVFYAYEAADGIRLRVSPDAGQSFGAAVTAGAAGAYAPTVFAREVLGAVRIDLLYLAAVGMGNELHASRWPVFGASPREDYRLTTTTVVPIWALPPQPPNPFAYGFRITQVGWFGYDAVLDGGQIVVVLDEESFDTAALCFGAPRAGLAGQVAGGPVFTPAEPPPLAPGMILPVPPPLPGHRHQLRLFRID